MQIKFKPFRIQIEKYHIEGGNIYPGRILNLKKVAIILAIIIGIIIALTSCSKPNQYDCPTVYKHTTEDMPTLVKSSNDVKLVQSDNVDGRQTYNVIFPDGTVLDSMYPEEIANGLVTGKWDYNEDFQIK